MKPTIRDAYISVEIEDRGLDGLSAGLRSLFREAGVECERASGASHVSIAYGDGEIEVEALERAACEIASLPFSVHVAGFDILSGQTTPYDYLVVVLEGASFGAAHSTASCLMKTRSFHGGFSSHVSLLKFPKGRVSREWAARILSEMNECQALARFFRRRRLQGAAVAVFGADRRCRLMKSIAATAA